MRDLLNLKIAMKGFNGFVARSSDRRNAGLRVQVQPPE